MTDFSRIAAALLFFTAAAAPAAGRECGPEALGVSRTLIVNRAKGTAVGLQTYPRTLDLRDHEVILTFDDGPAAPTAQILDALAKECALATFFVIGRNAEESPQTVKRETAEGHSVGHHSFSHPAVTLRLLDDEDAREDIDKGIKAVERAAGGKAAPFFRFPGFADTPALLAYLEGRGYTVFGSDLWASDWSPMSPKGELELVMTRLDKAGRGVILFHDSRAQTAQMLPEFLRELKIRGYRLVHMAPGDDETPVVAAGPDWTSTTEPIIAKTLAGKKKLPRHAPAADAGGEGHTHPGQ